MIYCVDCKELESFLLTKGYVRQPSQSEKHALFATAAGKPLTLRAPNHNGHTPENLLDFEFNRLRIDPPRWTLFWCD